MTSDSVSRQSWPGGTIAPDYAGEREYDQVSYCTEFDTRDGTQTYRTSGMISAMTEFSRHQFPGKMGRSPWRLAVKFQLARQTRTVEFS